MASIVPVNVVLVAFKNFEFSSPLNLYRVNLYTVQCAVCILYSEQPEPLNPNSLSKYLP